MRLLIFLFLTTGCSLLLGGGKAPESAKNQYTISFNSPDWTLKANENSDYVYENTVDGRIMLSNSFCKEFQDQPLDNLAQKTFRSVGSFKVKDGKYNTFNSRESYELEGSGEVDGVPVALKLLNTRRNNCYFDFLSITPLNSATKQNQDFMSFLKAVEFK